jgi:hypothetical protein
MPLTGRAKSVTSWTALRELLRRWLAAGDPPSPSDKSVGRLLVDVAGEQGVTGLLYQATCDPRLQWSSVARAALRQAEQDSFATGVRQLDTARRVQDLLGARGIRCLPLKGAALAERLYDSVSHRPMADVDLLVFDEWPRAVELLEETGFAGQRQADHAREFLDPVLGTVVELHRGVTSCVAFFPLDGDAVWERTRPGTGLVKRVPSSEDLLVHLSLHAAFQHGLALSLVQFLDFRRLLERDPPDPAALAEIATAARARRSVALALEAARVVVAAPIGPDLEKLVTAWLPPSLRRFLASKLRDDPSALLIPAEPAVASIRWKLAGGHKLALVRETLSPRVSAFSRTPGRASRAMGLARRWALPTVRSLRS